MAQLQHPWPRGAVSYSGRPVGGPELVNHTGPIKPTQVGVKLVESKHSHGVKEDLRDSTRRPTNNGGAPNGLTPASTASFLRLLCGHAVSEIEASVSSKAIKCVLICSEVLAGKRGIRWSRKI